MVAREWRVSRRLGLVLLAVLCGRGFGVTQLPQYHAIELYIMTPPAGITGMVFAGGIRGVDTNGASVGSANDSRPQAHALLWSPNGSVTDLTPTGFAGAQVYSIASGQQVGFANILTTGPVTSHAMLWNGSNQGIDLHPAGFSTSTGHETDGQQQVGVGRIGSTDHALLWNGSNAAIDLNPPGFLSSTAYGVGGGQQVGGGFNPTLGRFDHALLWNGTSTAVDLNPVGLETSEAYGTYGNEQVGYGYSPDVNNQAHALLWHGTNQATDLNPAGFYDSEAHATNGTMQVGWGGTSSSDSYPNALLWNGTNVAIDLQSLLPSNLLGSQATSIDAGGNVFGFAYDAANVAHVMEWSPVPEPTGLWAIVVGCLGLTRHWRKQPGYFPRRQRRIA